MIATEGLGSQSSKRLCKNGSGTSPPSRRSMLHHRADTFNCAGCCPFTITGSHSQSLIRSAHCIFLHLAAISLQVHYLSVMWKDARENSKKNLHYMLMPVCMEIVPMLAIMRAATKCSLSLSHASVLVFRVKTR